MRIIELIAAGLLALAIAASPVHAQDDAGRESDLAQIADLGQAWQDAWNSHDAAALAALTDPELVFVSVLGPDTPNLGRGGREGFQAGHAALFQSMFSESVWRNEEVAVVRWLGPNLAVVLVLWTTTGDRVRHLPPRTPRRGIFTWVVERQGDRWVILASQNTEAAPALAEQ